MIHTRSFGNHLKKMGYDFFAGVPCSFLKYFINYAINDCQYIAAANEGDAISIAAGAYLGGKKAVVLMQNSGLANAVSPLVSLNYPFKIPVLGFVTLRGEEGISDEPQHDLMGRITTDLLKKMKIKHTFLSEDLEQAKEQLLVANSYIEQDNSYFFIVRKGTFSRELIREQKQIFHDNVIKILQCEEDQLPSRFETLTLVDQLKDNNTVQLATTGKTGRELHEIEDAANNLYLVGSMGCISSLGLGLALTKKAKDIVVLDGDGSLLMRLGALATNGYYHPPNLLHILLDNHTYDSTGGQFTVSPNVNFVEMAAACGYARSIYVHNLTQLKKEIEYWKTQKSLTFLYLRIAKGSKKDLGRPHLKPFEVKDRLKVFLND